MQIQAKSIKAEALAKTIRGQMSYYGLSPEETALAAHMSPSTLYRRLRYPETFQIGELLNLAGFLRFTITLDLLDVTQKLI